MTTKKRFFELFFALACVATFSLPANAASLPKIMVYGDSLVSGYRLQAEQAYPARLQRKLREMGYKDVTVINASRENLTSINGYDKVQPIIDQNPDIVVVAFGTDDVERGIGVEYINQNISLIAGRISQAGAYVVLAGMKAPSSLGFNYVKQFEAMYPAIATSRKTYLVPDILAGVVGNAQLTLADGLHPTARGVDIMVENSYRAVDQAIRAKIEAIQYQEKYKAYQDQLLKTNR